MREPMSMLDGVEYGIRCRGIRSWSKGSVQDGPRCVGLDHALRFRQMMKPEQSRVWPPLWHSSTLRNDHKSRKTAIHSYFDAHLLCASRTSSPRPYRA